MNWRSTLYLILLGSMLRESRVFGEHEDSGDEEGDNDSKEAVDRNCVDKHASCEEWSQSGECENNPNYMEVQCRKSCRMCASDVYGDPDYMPPHVRHHRAGDLGVPQQLLFHDGTWEEDILFVIAKARNYMYHVVPKKFEDGIREVCQNQHQECAYWAVTGECEYNPEYMARACGPVCGACEALAIEYRCPVDPDAEDAWEKPGDLNDMFEKITSEPYLSRYSVEVWSSPRSGGPWLVTLEDFISAEEAVRLIELGGELGYERSSDVGAIQEDGSYSKDINEGRTSMNAWCIETCEEDELAQAVVKRINELTGIPSLNSEYLQLLRYQEGQKYDVHHDYIEHHVWKQCGPRILTVYMYLNDVVAGGGTQFDQLNVTVTPKRGRVAIWPSVLDDDPDEWDERTTHLALPVEKGIKYGANAWIHLRDFKTPHGNDCIG